MNVLERIRRRTCHLVDTAGIRRLTIALLLAASASAVLPGVEPAHLPVMRHDPARGPAVIGPDRTPLQAPLGTALPHLGMADRHVRSRYGRTFLTAADTINGEAISDPRVIERIERVAAGVPDEWLVGRGQDAQAWYLAHAFAAGDDAAISYGLFRTLAAALAFGCALDDALTDRCTPVELPAPQAAYEDPPGILCTPLGIALGAPVYEPDRCGDKG